jgi:hypothetical protein
MEWYELGGLSFLTDVPKAAAIALATVYQTGRRVRIFVGDLETGTQWLEDWHVIGRIGRSAGNVKIPLLINNRRSHGGDPLNNVIRVVDVTSGQDLYRAENYRLPVLTEYELDKPLHTSDGYTLTHGVKLGRLSDGNVVARFTSKAKAQAWIGWQHGERMRSW